MISSKNKCVFIRNISNISWQIILDAWCASINVASKCPIAWNISRHAPAWRFYLHCGIEETSSPGIICIVCQQVLHHPSKHGTSSTGKDLVAKAQIAKLKELKNSEFTILTSSSVDETGLAILKRQWSSGIMQVSLLRKFIFAVQVWSILTELTDKMHQTGTWGLWNFQISPRHV